MACRAARRGGLHAGACRRSDQAGVCSGGGSRGRSGSRRHRRRGPCPGAARPQSRGEGGVTTYLFVGPTLARTELGALCEFICLPPAAQGDVYHLARSRPRAIGIIDGYFDGMPAVWHKEILWALTQGIHVFGSASMGALRAAELHEFGMRGIGRIFEW